MYGSLFFADEAIVSVEPGLHGPTFVYCWGVLPGLVVLYYLLIRRSTCEPTLTQLVCCRRGVVFWLEVLSSLLIRHYRPLSRDGSSYRSAWFAVVPGCRECAAMNGRRYSALQRQAVTAYFSSKQLLFVFVCRYCWTCHVWLLSEWWELKESTIRRALDHAWFRVAYCKISTIM